MMLTENAYWENELLCNSSFFLFSVVCPCLTYLCQVHKLHFMEDYYAILLSLHCFMSRLPIQKDLRILQAL